MYGPHLRYFGTMVIVSQDTDPPLRLHECLLLVCYYTLFTVLVHSVSLTPPSLLPEEYVDIQCLPRDHLRCHREWCFLLIPGSTPTSWYDASLHRLPWFGSKWLSQEETPYRSSMYHSKWAHFPGLSLVWLWCLWWTKIIHTVLRSLRIHPPGVSLVLLKFCSCQILRLPRGERER